MILPVDKRDLPGDELVPLDAPHHMTPSRAEKAGPSSSSIAAWSLSSQDKAPRRPAPWFSFSAYGRAARSVRVTVLGILRDVVKHAARPESLGLLTSCSDACRTYDLSFSAILQEPSVEGHTPIYWAVINRPPEPPREDTPDLVTALLTMAAPLADATLSELRLACLQTSDQALFQRLRLSPAFAPLSGTEEIILGGSVPPDEVVVEEMPGDEGAFAVCVRFPLFQKRMRISKEVALEFIARGRLWSLKFFVVAEHDMRTGFKYYAPGTWVVTLALLEHSPPTCIDSAPHHCRPTPRSARVPIFACGGGAP
ncbi:hypothetical protein A0H81_10144 [Grifola frondosa]|uniref:Uncharacterized protein n=1 Tax=Grifola frondosa TaxID=5627 RepID=A0A1C7LZE0_GRIFR|nr:hypothetical protein A0H81_10144 [Grifola frondosa]